MSDNVFLITVTLFYILKITLVKPKQSSWEVCLIKKRKKKKKTLNFRILARGILHLFCTFYFYAVLSGFFWFPFPSGICSFSVPSLLCTWQQILDWASLLWPGTLRFMLLLLMASGLYFSHSWEVDVPSTLLGL